MVNEREEQRIKELLRQGRHREAGDLLIERGELKRAMEAYAAVWDYNRAAEIALAAADRPRALDYLLRAGDRAAAAEVRAKLAKGSGEEVERAVTLLLERGERDQAARLLEASGDPERAAELVRELGEVRRAASLLERAGRYREAGRLYERLLANEPDDAATALSLANILRRFGRHEQAARYFQIATRQPRLRRAALRGLVVSLAGMGLAEAASAALRDLLQEDGSAPRTVEALLQREAQHPQEDESEQWVGGRYQIVKLLGGGAAGRVYLARDALYEREIALKVINAGSGETAGRDAFTRFVREAQIAAKLDHPNIVRVLDFDEAAGFLVMEHLGGGTLADRLGEGLVPLALVRDVLLGVLAALETAHLRGVIHRDVKPQNVLFDQGGGVKLVDFGVAHLQDLGLTQTGAFIGTLAYMAPEQITGDKLSAATDLYGLGATAFHALCGRPPFAGADLIRQHLAEAPPLPSELRPALGDRFDELFQRLLAKVPADRFANAGEVRRLVRALDFTDPEEEEAPFIKAPAPIRSERSEETFTDLEPPRPWRGGAARRGRHSRLDMVVSLVDLPELADPAQLELLASFGRATSPYLQRVIDIDPEKGEAVVEEPEGVSLAETLAAEGAWPPAEALELIDSVTRGLEAVHLLGLTHGEVGPERVRQGRYRAVLLLPERGDATATPDRDLSDLISLLAVALGEPREAGLDRLLVAGPLAEALGPRRATSLSDQLPRTLDAPGLRAFLNRVRGELSERARSREHLHALAAAARAAGADPRTGPLAELLETRRAELDL